MSDPRLYDDHDALDGALLSWAWTRGNHSSHVYPRCMSSESSRSPSNPNHPVMVDQSFDPIENQMKDEVA